MVILGNKRHFVLKILNKNDYIIFSRLFFIINEKNENQNKIRIKQLNSLFKQRFGKPTCH